MRNVCVRPRRWNSLCPVRRRQRNEMDGGEKPRLVLAPKATDYVWPVLELTSRFSFGLGQCIILPALAWPRSSLPHGFSFSSSFFKEIICRDSVDFNFRRPASLFFLRAECPGVVSAKNLN